MGSVKKNETIVALATPPAPAALAIIRISGDDALKVLDIVFKPIKNHRLKPRVLTLGWVIKDNKQIDQAMAVYMPAPRSYTGEDIAELHLHGSIAIINELLNEIAELPFVRLAEPGEFTKRAFFNNKLDLLQAEAVAELIASKNNRAATIAAQQLNGSLSQVVKDCKNNIVGLSAYYVANLDFSEEDVTSISSKQAVEKLQSVKKQLQTTLKNSQHQHITKEGLKIALVGLPNAGKSSLLNLLLGFDRAIVSPIKGTTRDIISESISISGINCVITDTAGLHSSKNEIEKIGIELTKQEISNSDHVFVLIEPQKQTDSQKYIITNKLDTILSPKNTTIVFTKKDIEIQKPNKFFGKYSNILVDNKRAKSVDSLIIQIKNLIEKFDLDYTQTLTERQKKLITAALQRTDELILLIEKNTPDDVVLIELQGLVETFNTLSGEHSSEEIITEVFSNFCIGK